MFYYFQKVKNATETQNRFVQCMQEGSVTDQKWFAKLPLLKIVEIGDFLLDDASWLGRPVEVDCGQIETLIENSQCSNLQEKLTHSKYPNQYW